MELNRKAETPNFHFDRSSDFAFQKKSWNENEYMWFLSGFPKCFTSVSELTYFVTMVIFNASAQHAAVNNAQVTTLCLVKKEMTACSVFYFLFFSLSSCAAGLFRLDAQCPCGAAASSSGLQGELQRKQPAGQSSWCKVHCAQPRHHLPAQQETGWLCTNTQTTHTSHLEHPTVFIIVNIVENRWGSFSHIFKGSWKL